MARTTLDIDDPILKELRRLHKRARKSLGKLVSELLAEALARLKQNDREPAPFEWTVRNMRPRLEYSDKEQLWAALDRSGKGR